MSSVEDIAGALFFGAFGVAAAVGTCLTFRRRRQWHQADAIVCFGSEAEAGAEGRKGVRPCHLMFETPAGPCVVRYGPPDDDGPSYEAGTVLRIAYNPAAPSEIIVGSTGQIIFRGAVFTLFGLIPSTLIFLGVLSSSPTGSRP